MHCDDVYLEWVIFCSAAAFGAGSSCFSFYRFGFLVSGCWVGRDVEVARVVSLKLPVYWSALSLLAKTPKEFCVVNKRLNNPDTPLNNSKRKIRVSAHFTEEGKNAR
jgi:hypothetical protein